MRSEPSLEAGTTEIWRLAAASLSVAIVLVDGMGRTVYADYLEKFGQKGFAQRVLLDRAVSGIRRDGKAGLFRQQALEIFGPPRSYFQLESKPLGEGENPPFVVVIEDVTTRRQLEEIRRDFVANVSHELKTPVGAIVLLADAMSQETEPDTLLRLANRILSEGDRLAHLVSDLLDLSKIEETSIDLSRKVNLLELVAEIIERSTPSANEKQISLELSARLDDPEIEGERWQLSSAFSNLVDNAVKYSEPGTSVTVSLEGAADGVAVKVMDHGIGIPARDLHRIFERFYRVDADRARTTGGTGLGLSIVRHVIDNHHGEIAVSSTEGVGTTFTITLPRSAR